jgi:hypothetical protein
MSTSSGEVSLDPDGLWLAEFSTSEASGGGVIVLSKGRAVGGDGSYYYVGTYSVNDGQIKALLNVRHYSGALGSVFGPYREIPLKIEGLIGGDLIMAQGYDARMPNRRASFKLRRVPNTKDYLA